MGIENLKVGKKAYVVRVQKNFDKEEGITYMVYFHEEKITKIISNKEGITIIGVPNNDRPIGNRTMNWFETEKETIRYLEQIVKDCKNKNYKFEKLQDGRIKIKDKKWEGYPFDFEVKYDS